MTITKRELKILKYIYSRKTVSYKKLSNKFKKYLNLKDTLESMTYHHYLAQIGGSQNNLGEPIPITDETLFSLDSIGSAEVENKQWFSPEYIVSHIIIPIVLAVISTLITIFLTNALSQSRQTSQQYQLQQEQHIQKETQ